MSENQTSDKKKLPLFHLSDRYPDIQSLWNISLPKAQMLNDDAIFVLDTNVLLLPYKTSKESLEKIKEVYSALINTGRLFVPDQAIREFISNKSGLIEGIYKSLSSAKENAKDLQLKGYPSIKSMDKYQELCKLQTQINSQLKTYNEIINGILQEIASWQHDDPVSRIYKELFTDKVIVSCELERSEIEKDFKHRVLNEIPPGYSDSKKPDSGIGDVIIWLTILKLGETHKKPLIFVTSERKEDWWELFNKKPVSPRLELVDEYKRHSDQNNFSILELSELLETFDVNEEIIEEVKSEENSLLTTAEIRGLFENNQSEQIHYLDSGLNFPVRTVMPTRPPDLKEVSFRLIPNKNPSPFAEDVETFLAMMFPRATLTKIDGAENPIYKLNFNGHFMTAEAFNGRLNHIDIRGFDVDILEYEYQKF